MDQDRLPCLTNAPLWVLVTLLIGACCLILGSVLGLIIGIL